MRTSKASKPQSTPFDYRNSGWPRDFDIRIEVAEQQEVLKDSRWFKLADSKPAMRQH